MLVFWLSLGFAIAGLVVGVLLALVRGLRAWRDLKATGGRISEQLDAVAESTTKIAVHLDNASASSARLSAALERLARARATLDVQRAALREARDVIGRALPFLPSR